MKCLRPNSFKTTSRDEAIKPNKNNRILWHIDETYVTDDLQKFKIIAQFHKAFNAWQEYFSPIIFESTSDITEAPIVLRFMSDGNPKLPSPFGETTLAYAYYPHKESLGIHSDVYFNDKYNWAEMHSDLNISLWKVAVHELGHAFGIDHNNILDDIMYPMYQPNDSVNITKDTRDAVAFLYEQVTAQPEVDVIEPGIKGFLNRLFENRKHLDNLTEEQLLELSKSIGANVKLYYLKKDNIRNILKKLDQ